MEVPSDRILGITTRTGGVSDYPSCSMNMAHYIDDTTDNVIRNQQLLADRLNIDRNRWVFPIQIHSNKIAHITKQHCGININHLTTELHGYDGLYTTERDILLTMCFADCVPVYIYSPADNFTALAHAGWRGTKGMVVKELIDCYAVPEVLVVIIGPSICKECYEVTADIKNQFDDLPFCCNEFFELKANGMYKVNLQALNRAIAVEAGVRPENIQMTSICTAEDERFFSYRTEKGHTGRMLAFIGKRENDGSER